MTPIFHAPWLELCLLTPLIGSLWVRVGRNATVARRRAMWIAGATLGLAIGEGIDFALLGTFEAYDRWDALARLAAADVLVVDALSAPLFVLVALIYAVTILATPREKVSRFTFARALFSEAVVLATFSCRAPAVVAGLLVVGALVPRAELRARGATRAFPGGTVALLAGSLGGGCLLTFASEPESFLAVVGALLLTVGTLLRAGILPFHRWVIEFFDRVTFGTALLATTPMVGAYAVMRLVVPIAPTWLLSGIASLSLLSAVYCAGLAVVQEDARRFFACLLLSQSAMVLVGIDLVNPIGMAGALSVWLSAGLSLAGFGLVLRAVEARIGRFSVVRFHGLFEHMPTLASLFLLTGLAAVGFPGTVGFVGTELLIEGVAEVAPLIGLAVVLATALNGISIVRAYLLTVGGPAPSSSSLLRVRPRERVAILILTALIIGGGLFPQPGITSRYAAAVELVRRRDEVREEQRRGGSEATPQRVHIMTSSRNSKTTSGHIAVPED